MKASKWLRFQLINKAKTVVLKRKLGRLFSEVESEVYIADLCRFKSAHVSVTAVGAKILASALLTAIPRYLYNSLFKLDLRLTSVSPPDLAAQFGTCSELVQLELSDNKLADEHLKVLAPALAHCSKLRHIRIRNNPIGEAGAETLEDVLSSCPSLESVDLLGCDLTEGLGDRHLELARFSGGMRENASLTRLNLTACKIGDAAASNLGAARFAASSLRVLNLGLNRLSEAGATALASGLGRCSALRALSLEHNPLQDSGITALADAVQGYTSLETLSCHHAGIGDAGGERVAGLLPVCPRLSSLNMAMNSLSDCSATAMADALDHNSSLSYLNLESNRIGDPGAMQFASVVSRREAGLASGGLKLFLACNAVSEGAQERLAATLGSTCMYGLRVSMALEPER